MTAVVCAVVLGIAFYVAMRFTIGGDLVRYSLTGMFWKDTTGMVANPRQTMHPTVAFQTPDGTSHVFSEDYLLLCGARSLLCELRMFQPQQPVLVVYDPARPELAWIRDWDLFVSVIEVRAFACILIALLWLFAFKLSKPGPVSLQWGSMRSEEGSD